MSGVIPTNPDVSLLGGGGSAAPPIIEMRGGGLDVPDSYRDGGYRESLLEGGSAPVIKMTGGGDEDAFDISEEEFKVASPGNDYAAFLAELKDCQTSSNLTKASCDNVRKVLFSVIQGRIKSYIDDCDELGAAMNGSGSGSSAVAGSGPVPKPGSQLFSILKFDDFATYGGQLDSASNKEKVFYLLFKFIQIFNAIFTNDSMFSFVQTPNPFKLEPFKGDRPLADVNAIMQAFDIPTRVPNAAELDRISETLRQKFINMYNDMIKYLNPLVADANKLPAFNASIHNNDMYTAMRNFLNTRIADDIAGVHCDTVYNGGNTGRMDKLVGQYYVSDLKSNAPNYYTIYFKRENAPIPNYAFSFITFANNKIYIGHLVDDAAIGITGGLFNSLNPHMYDKTSSSCVSTLGSTAMSNISSSELTLSTISTLGSTAMSNISSSELTLSTISSPISTYISTIPLVNLSYINELYNSSTFSNSTTMSELSTFSNNTPSWPPWPTFSNNTTMSELSTFSNNTTMSELSTFSNSTTIMTNTNNILNDPLARVSTLRNKLNTLNTTNSNIQDLFMRIDTLHHDLDKLGISGTPNIAPPVEAAVTPNIAPPVEAADVITDLRDRIDELRDRIAGEGEAPAAAPQGLLALTLSTISSPISTYISTIPLVNLSYINELYNSSTLLAEAPGGGAADPLDGIFSLVNEIGASPTARAQHLHKIIPTATRRGGLRNKRRRRRTRK